MRELAETLLPGPSTLTSGEREMIAAFVSARNDCHFCQASHSAAAAHNLDGEYEVVEAVSATTSTAPVVGEAQGAPRHRRQVQRAANR